MRTSFIVIFTRFIYMKTALRNEGRPTISTFSAYVMRVAKIFVFSEMFLIGEIYMVLGPTVTVE